jgi:hypothetical protein
MTDSDYESVADYIREKYTLAIGWGDMKPWLKWYYEQKLLGVIRLDGVITGVGMVRFGDDQEQLGRDAYYTHPNGKICWVEMICSSDPKSLAALIGLLISVWGVRERVAFHHGRRHSRILNFPFKLMARASFKGLTMLRPTAKQL